jgi:hypothetical protein
LDEVDEPQLALRHESQRRKKTVRVIPFQLFVGQQPTSVRCCSLAARWGHATVR